MINAILNSLGLSSTSDQMITYIVTMGAVILVCCLAYSFVDFLFSLVLSLVGRKDKSKSLF